MGTDWQTDARLKGRFHPDYPDDLQVLVHDGGPRMTPIRSEVMWVRVTGAHGAAYEGTLLNKPVNLRTVREGGKVLFLPPSNEKLLPIRTTDEYLNERENWVIKPCTKCGQSELFDAPTPLARKIFPDAAKENMLPLMFSTFCPLCGDVIIVRAKNADSIGSQESASKTSDTSKPKWWEFWKNK